MGFRELLSLGVPYEGSLKYSDEFTVIAKECGADVGRCRVLGTVSLTFL